MTWRQRIRYQKYMAVVLVVFTAILGVMPALPVKAESTIERMIVVSPDGGNHAKHLKKGVELEDNYDGDSAQHLWAWSFDEATNLVNSLSRDELKKTAVVVWGGEKYLDSDVLSMVCGDGTPVEGNTVDIGHDPSHTSIPDFIDADGNPDDTIKGDSAANRNAQRLTRSLWGYDYQVEELVIDVAFVPKVPEVPEVPEEGYTDDDGNFVVTQHYVPKVPEIPEIPEEFHIDTKQMHAKGYAEIWNEAGLAVTYLYQMGPQSKYAAYPNVDEVGSQSELEMMEKQNEQNKKVIDFNNGLSRTTNLFDELLEHNPHFSNGSGNLTTTQDVTSSKYYDMDTYQWIYHVIWNTVLMSNIEPDESTPPIDTGFYSVSASLTAYMNNKLSPNSSSGDANFAWSGLNAGNAGALIGYGDKDYDFQEYITHKLSKTSSTVSYDALKISSDSVGHYNDLEHYGRYGRLLADMGFDKTAPRSATISTRTIPGAAIFIAFSLAEGTQFMFNMAIGLVQDLNPFYLFAEAANIADGAKDAIITGNNMYEQHATNVVVYIGELYDAIQNLGMNVTVPLLIAFLAVALLLKRESFGKTMWGFGMRITFIMIGVPIMGMIYTSGLNYLNQFTATSTSAGSQLIASTFLDFEEWVKDSRLSPDTGVFESQFIGDTGVSIASEQTYLNLRKTCAQINNKSGATTSVNMNDLFIDGLSDRDETLDDNLSWTTTGLSVNLTSSGESFAQVSNILRSYMAGDTYNAGTFETQTLAMLPPAKMGKLPQEGDADDINKNTMYELFDYTNETSDWNERSNDENHTIFRGDYTTPVGSAATWKGAGVSIFSNSNMTSTVSGAERELVTYQAAGSGSGLSIGSNTGLSTMAMYNYLNTSFNEKDMTIYSSSEAMSEYTKPEHYSVNCIGSGAFSALFYANCFVVLFVTAILALCYIVKMLIQTIKRGIDMICAIPGAMLGMLKSIVEFISIVVMMLFEVLGTIILYMLLSQLLVAFIGVFETATGDLVRGMIATAGMYDVTANTAIYQMFSLGATSLLLFVLGVWLYKRSAGAVAIYDFGILWLYNIALDKSVLQSYRQREDRKQEQVDEKTFGFSEIWSV